MPSLATLDDRRLLAELLGTAAAAGVQRVSVAALLDAGAGELAALGLSPATRRRLLAAAELARRYQPAAAPPPASCERPQHFLPHLEPLRASRVEVLGVLTLDARLGLLGGLCEVASGAVMHVAVSAREVFAPAIDRRAVAIVLAHNHPSGDPEPSPEDRAFTQLMSRAGAILGIQVLDHLVVTRRSYFSFAEARMLSR
jgi:DNA repair protein RadC